jgi:hypothetical protein
MLPFHYECSGTVAATDVVLFDHLDRHDRLAGHMTKSSWMMAGGRMRIVTDALSGRALGSRIRIGGRVMGLRLFAEEIVTEYEAPRRKAWATVGDVRLLVIGPYRMGFEIEPRDSRSGLRVFIDYARPGTGMSRWLGRLLGSWYARWCTKRMLADAVAAFAAADRPGGTGLPIERAPAR